jgi:hypothetical protein
MAKLRLAYVIGAWLASSALWGDDVSSSCRGCERRLNLPLGADLLPEGEAEVSVNTQILPGIDARMRVSEELEMGSNLLLLPGGLFNAYLKHRMFSTPSTDTSFASFNAFIIPSKESSLFFSTHGVTTNYYLHSTTALHYGLWHMALMTRNEEKESVLAFRARASEYASAYLLQLGFDSQLTSSIAVFADLYPLVVGYMDVVGDTADISLELRPTSKHIPFLLNSGVQFFVTDDWSFSLYAQGILPSSSSVSMGLSVAWRTRP